MGKESEIMKRVISASAAIAEAARLCRARVVPCYPITPQTIIVEELSSFINNGQMDAEMIYVESEHSALSALIGAMAVGARGFTATSSQGFALMYELLPIVSGLRLPAVMAVANRALSAPINIWNDHSDSVSARDQGWLQVYAESSQEALDTTIQMYKICENAEVLLPGMVCIDGFTLSHVYEPVEILEQEAVDKFLPAYKPRDVLDVNKPISIGPIAFPDTFMEFRLMQENAMKEALKAVKKVNFEFKEMFGRSYGNGLIEEYMMNDAEIAIVGMGTLCGTARVAVDELRKDGVKAGLVKLRTFRPFPREALVNALRECKSIAVIDRHVSLGNEGALASEIKAALFGEKKAPAVMGFISGLGGRDITVGHLKKAVNDAKNKREEWLL